MSAYDLLIRNGTVVDGTNSPGFRADVAVKDGRIVLIAPEVDPSTADRVIDATDRVVSPGFIDNHTHYDGQVLWDATLDVSSSHGVTTVYAGNCGMSLAPVNEESAAYMLSVLSKVEGIPFETLEAGVKITWSSFAEMLDALEGRVGINIGFLVGHSTLRSLVMGDRCVDSEATAEEIEAMAALLRESLEAGGLGFSTSEAETHTDRASRPIASRYAARDEFLALARVAGEYEGTKLEYVPTIKGFTDETREWLADLSVAAGRPLDFPLLMDVQLDDERVEGLFQSADVARARGGEVLPQVACQAEPLYFNLRSGFAYEALPEPWGEIYLLSHDERLARFQDPETLDRLEQAAKEQVGKGDNLSRPANFDALVLSSTSGEYAKFVGQTLGEIGREWSCSGFRAFVKIALSEDLKTVVSVPPPAGSNERAGWERRVRILRDNRGVISASDAGAHNDVMDQYAQTSRLFQYAVAKFGLMPVEEAVHMLTQEQAELVGLKERGVLKEGYWADILVFDPSSMGTTSTELRPDLPAGGSRLVCGNTGIDHVIVNGTPMYEFGEYTGSLSGKVLRSARDTETVKIPRYAPASA